MGAVRRRAEARAAPEPPRDQEGHAEFLARESPLTELLRTSPHIRAIYHIFIVILLVLLADTLVYDLLDTGTISVGVGTVRRGFGSVVRAARLWLWLAAVALCYHPLLRAYRAVATLPALQARPVLRRAWGAAGWCGVCAVQGALLAPACLLAADHLALASAVTVCLEMLRFCMKLQSCTAVLGARVAGRDRAPLPSFSHYVYFLFAPTLLYRDHYPRTKRIRWGVACYHFAEVGAIIFYNSFLWERFILPYWSHYGKTPTVEAGAVVRGMFACVLPGVISFLCGFYCLLHAWLNACAEIMTFADRLFYQEWWTASRYSTYFRLWNRVVHRWLSLHLHAPLAARLPRPAATFLVFLVSALAHEAVLALSFGFCYPVLLVQFGGLGALLVPLTARGGAHPHVYNLLMWLSFFLGNGLLWSLYPMEYFARQNCPPAPGDSYFVPKSWSCPTITLKPGWHFHNPFTTLHS